MQFRRLCRVTGTLPGLPRRRIVFSPAQGPDAPADGLASDVAKVTGPDGALEVLLVPGLWRIIGAGVEADIMVPDAPRADLGKLIRIKE